MKKCKLIIVAVLCTILLNTVVYANEIGIVNSNSENEILNDDMKFTKKIVDYNKETQEIEIELCIQNIKKNQKDEEDIEIAIVLDNSGSMSLVESNSSRKQTTYNAAYKFVNLIYDNIKKLKLEVAQFSDNTSILTQLTDKKEEVLNALTRYNKMRYGGNTNTHIALQNIEKTFTTDCKNKVVVLLTDGYPNYPEQTKAQLKKLEEDGIYILSLIVSNESNLTQIEEVFGTVEKPTAGNVYYIENSKEIEKVFNEYIYEQILTYMEHPIKNVKIEDVFPEELLKYFDIEYINNPDKGMVTDIDDNNSFIWSVDEIKGEEVVKFRYKVKIKKDVDTSKLIGKELKTNEKVIINYEDEDENKKEEILDKNPIIRVKEEISCITEEDEITVDVEKETTIPTQEEKEFVIVDMTPKEEPKVNNETKKTTTKTDNTKRLPQTGKNDFIIFAICASIMLVIILGIKTELITKKINKLQKK